MALSTSDCALQAAGYVLVRVLGRVPTAANAASKKPVYLHYSAGRHDHFTSANAAPPGGYGSLGMQGYLLDKAVKASVPLAWYWSPEGRGATAKRGDNVLAQYDGAAAANPTSCAHEWSDAEACFAAAKQVDGIGTAIVHTSTGASDTGAPGLWLPAALSPCPSFVSAHFFCGLRPAGCVPRCRC